MKEKTKKYIVPGTTLLFSFFLSSLFAFGGIIGYIATNVFCKKYIHTGKVKSLVFDFGEWEVHIHHWLYGVIAILAIVWIESLSLIPNLYIGVLGGLIFHDLYTDKKWYKVVYNKKPSS